MNDKSNVVLMKLNFKYNLNAITNENINMRKPYCTIKYPKKEPASATLYEVMWCSPLILSY